MPSTAKTALAVSFGAALMASLAANGTAQQAQTMSVEHVLNIGTKGTGEGQFKYVEDFALSSTGDLLATDAAHAYVQVFDKTTSSYIARFI